MITGVKDVYYNVADPKRAIAFYTEALQMKVVFAHEHWIALDCGGVQVGLHPALGYDFQTAGRDSHGAHAQATLTLRSTNVPEDRERIVKHGGKILGENNADWGHMLVFEDTEGNVLKLMNPKS